MPVSDNAYKYIPLTNTAVEYENHRGHPGHQLHARRRRRLHAHLPSG
jgi:hypothetical protein